MAETTQILVTHPVNAATRPFVEDVAPFVTWALIVIGWWIVSRQNDKRERRREIRELIKTLEQRLDEITESVAEYYSVDGNSAKATELAPRIKAHVATVRMIVDRISAAGLPVNVVEQSVLLRQAATGGGIRR